MEELIISSNVMPATVTIDYEAISKAIDEVAKNYGGGNIVVTEETRKAAVSDEKDLAKLRNNLESKRKEIKKQLEKPIKDNDEKFKALISKVESIEAPLKKGIAEVDEKTKAKKAEIAKEIIEKTIAKFSLTPKYAKRLILKPEYSNLTATKPKVTENVENIATSLKALQDKEEKLLAELNGYLNEANTELERKFSADDFRDILELTLNSEADDFISQVKVKVEAQKQLEETIRIKAEESIKQAYEAKNETEEIKEDSPKIVSMEERKASPRDDARWEMVITLSGKSSDLKIVGDRMKNLCKINDCTYHVEVDKCRQIG